MFRYLKTPVQLSRQGGRAVSLLMLCVTLFGCGNINNSSFRNMSSAYREIVEEYTNDNLLINIARTSENMPMSFLDIPSVTGSGSVSPGVNAGITSMSAQPASFAGFFSSGQGSSYTLGASLSVNNSFTFTQSSLDNATFMQQFLQPLDLAVVQNLSTSEVVNQIVLYSLIIQSISVIESDGSTAIKLFNNPYSPHYADFQLALVRVVAADLQVQTTARSIPISPPLSASEATTNLMAISSAASTSNVTLSPIHDKSGKITKYQLEKSMVVPKLCFGTAEPLMDLDFVMADSAFCKPQPTVSTKANSVTAKKPVRTMQVEFRSPRDVFYFLGALVNLQNDNENPTNVGVLPTHKVRSGLTSADLKNESVPLLVVLKNPSIGTDALVSLNYMGNTYLIPKQDSGFSREVLTILAQVVTLAKVAGSIPVSPAVLIQ